MAHRRPPARIIVLPDGTETLTTDEPLYDHPLVRSRSTNSPWALHDACEIGDLLYVKAFFAPHPQNRHPFRDDTLVNRRDVYSHTPLYIAVLNGRYEIAKILVQNGAQMDMLLEGMSILHVLYTLCGSFPQYQVPMLEPNASRFISILTTRYQQLDCVQQQQPLVTSYQDVLIAPYLPQYQSFAIRMTHLLMDKFLLDGKSKEINRKDDNGKNIFHLIAQYDLIHVLVVVVDKLLHKYAQYLDPAIIQSGGFDFTTHRMNFFRILLAQDNQKRNVLHYCAQYRSIHVFNYLTTLLLQHPESLPPPQCTDMGNVAKISDLYSYIDRYHRTPLHYAYFFAAPYYTQLRLHSKQHTEHNFIGDSDDITTTKTAFDSFQHDPIVQAFLHASAAFTTLVNSPHYIGLPRNDNIFGIMRAQDIAQRTPLQYALSNAPEEGRNNSGNLRSVNILGSPSKNDPTNCPLSGNGVLIPTFKPTLINWSPRCFEHHTAPKITRKDDQPPPENVKRLQVLLNFTDGALRSNEFNKRVTTDDIVLLSYLYYDSLFDNVSNYLTTLPTTSAATTTTLITGGSNILATTSGPDGTTPVTSSASSTSAYSPNHITQFLFNPTKANFATTTPNNITTDHTKILTLQQLITHTLQHTTNVPNHVLHWNHHIQRATLSDVLRCHDFSYIARLMNITESIPEADDWVVTTNESIDVLHRDLHISVPPVTHLSQTPNEIKNLYHSAQMMYRNMHKSLLDKYSIDQQYKDGNESISTTSCIIPSEQIYSKLPDQQAGILKARHQHLSPYNSVVQSILFRERQSLNLNTGFAKAFTPSLPSHNNENIKINNTDSMISHNPCNSLVSLNDVEDTYNLPTVASQKVPMFPTQPLSLPRRNVPNETTGATQWSMELSPAVYTNSIIQSNGLVQYTSHYDDYQRLLTSEDGDSALTKRQRAVSYAGELSTTTPAPSITRHIPPPIPLMNMDDDTTLSAFSYMAALYAAGSVIDAVKRVIHGEYKNAFCAVRPPGHHSGPTGLVATDDAIGDSHGFCLLNNIAIGASYAKAMFPDIVKRVAVIDFDVHHGNGTEAIIQKLKPVTIQRTIQVPAHHGTSVDRICLSRSVYMPWHDAQDPDEVLFASVHGYNKTSSGEQFYPGTGLTTDGIVDAINERNNNPYRIIAQSHALTDEERQAFFSGTFTSRQQTMKMLKTYIDRQQEIAHEPHNPSQQEQLDKLNANRFSFNNNIDIETTTSTSHNSNISNTNDNNTKIVDSPQQQPLEPLLTQLPKPTSIYPGDVPTDIPYHRVIDSRPIRVLNAGLGKNTRFEWRKVWQHTILPGIVAHKPDIILISAGFDAHIRDKINSGHVGVDEDDYYWLTRQLMKVANLCCEGRIVSCLEGGYRIHGGLVSPFARSVAAHLRALNEGGAEKWTSTDVDIEVRVSDEVFVERQVIFELRENEARRKQHEEALFQQQQHATDTASTPATTTANINNTPVDHIIATSATPTVSTRPSRNRPPVNYTALDKKLSALSSPSNTGGVVPKKARVEVTLSSKDTQLVSIDHQQQLQWSTDSTAQQQTDESSNTMM